MFTLTSLLIFLFGCAAILLLIFFSFYCFFIMYDIIPPMRVPRPIKRSFGRETEFMEDQSIRPFKLVYCENEFEKIKNKIKMDLGNLLFNSMGSLHPISSEEVCYGMNINYIKDVADYWVNKFDWQRHVNTLNFSRQFVTQISGLDIHFIHVKPPQVISASITAYPILLLHSFPTSAYEFSSLIPLLVTNNGSRIIFEVVAPTLPGHGWSEAASEAGLDGCQAGFIMHELMTRLGYTKYFIHGGGPGGLVAEQIAAIHPE
ncbi:epoxide hydrolase 1 isoform X3 [Eurytemora carolleeae]|uniref:epoxide hydrolase 1 isoform X3 n=1 Tax=Eurytemora carolleeae TaxID=1294199 RepID=UPI000C77C7CD|nr:epoxide hydrolase 1 isoform X3 [Eurytemora carolleeae]|eukprot:XP_023333278.1 epoxide hydrolase 1-like isoform X3 [Eurytemora affinis]